VQSHWLSERDSKDQISSEISELARSPFRYIFDALYPSICTVFTLNRKNDGRFSYDAGRHRMIQLFVYDRKLTLLRLTVAKDWPRLTSKSIDKISATINAFGKFNLPECNRHGAKNSCNDQFLHVQSSFYQVKLRTFLRILLNQFMALRSHVCAVLTSEN
jgi:hypothetical protein